MSPEERIKFIREYEWLRRLAHDLAVQSATVERRLVELEFLLPDRYQYRSDVLPKSEQ